MDMKNIEERLKKLEKENALQKIEIENLKRQDRIIETVFNEKHPDCFTHRKGNLD